MTSYTKFRSVRSYTANFRKQNNGNRIQGVVFNIDDVAIEGTEAALKPQRLSKHKKLLLKLCRKFCRVKKRNIIQFSHG